MQTTLRPMGAGYDVLNMECRAIGFVYKTLPPFSYSHTEVWKAQPHCSDCKPEPTYHTTRKGAIAAIQLFAQGGHNRA